MEKIMLRLSGHTASSYTNNNANHSKAVDHMLVWQMLSLFCFQLHHVLGESGIVYSNFMMCYSSTRSNHAQKCIVIKMKDIHLKMIQYW